MSKGYAVNRNAAHSKEQDILLLDAATSGALLNTSGIQYFPIESVLASIEIKSKLTLAEIRKSILNGLSVKNVNLMNPERKSAENNLCGTVWHTVFAYDCDTTLDRLAEVFNRETREIDKEKRPDLIYVLGKGLLFPGSKHGLDFKYHQSNNDGYQKIEAWGTVVIGKSEAYSFLWFLTCMIDHCIKELKERRPPSYFSYLWGPILMQLNVERDMEKRYPENYAKLKEAKKT